MKELTVKQAARKLQTTIDWVYKLIYAGKLPGHKEDGIWFISLAAVEAHEARRQERLRRMA